MTIVNLDDLTIGQAKELANRFAYAAMKGAHEAQHDLSEHLVGARVIVRTFSAGVHYGTLVKRQGTEVVLSDARRIWHWNKAFTLSKIAVNGVGQDSKLSVSVPDILLTEAIELIAVSDEVAKHLDSFPAHKPE